MLWLYISLVLIGFLMDVKSFTHASKKATSGKGMFRTIWLWIYELLFHLTQALYLIPWVKFVERRIDEK